MPCDHTDYDGSDCGSSHADSLEPFSRVSTNGFTNDKDSPASPMRHSSDKGKTACLFSHNPSLSSESPGKKIDCHSLNYHKGDSSSNAEHQLPTHGSKHGHKDFAEGETNSLTNDNNSPLALTTHNIDDEGRMSGKDSHLIKQRDSSRLVYCLRDYRDPVSMSELSLDKPKASISPRAETERKGMPSPHSMTANIPFEMQQNVKHAFPENEGYHIVGDMKRALHYNKASSPAGHSSMLYNFLHGAASREHYSGSEYSFDNIRHRSKVYTNFNGSSSLAPPYMNSSWDSDVNMKSPPKLVSYLSQHDMMAERSRLRRCSIDEGSHLSSPFDLSQGKSTAGDFESQYSSKTTMVKSEPAGARELSIFQSSHPPSMSSSSLTDDKAGTNEDGNEPNDNGTHFSSGFGFIVKKENESSPLLSPGALSRHNLTSPYASHSLSPWSNCGDFGHASDNRDTPIKDKVKCASDSNLYFPTVIHAPLSPSLSSIASKEGNEAIECRWKMCTETFCSQKALAQHVNDSHVRIERPDVNFQCHWHGCPRQGNGFNARYKMLIHIRTHTNEKPHKCAVCQKCFSRLENLKIHMRSHTGEKPYACMFPGCTKAYSNSSDRFKHVRTHQEEKPYKCKMAGCHKQYTDPSSLRKHVRTHGHGIKSVQGQLRRTVSEGDEIQHSDNMFGGKDQRPGLFSQHSIDFQADLNKGIKRSTDRDLSYDMDTGQHDMMDIQRNVELYSSLEVKNGIQKFEEVENLIRDDFHQTDLTRVAQQAPEMASERRYPGDSDYNHTTPSHSKPLLLSVPSIVIEEADDSVKSRQGDDNSVASERDLDESKFCHSRIKRKRFDVEEELHPNSSGVDEGAEDLRRGGKYSKNEVTSQSTSGLGEVIPSTSQCLPVVHKSTASPLESSSSSPSYPKHWKKRKIFDEERLQQEKQHQQLQRDENEEKEIKEAVQMQSEEKSKRCLSHDTLYEGMTAHFRPSPELNTSTHLLRSPDSRSLNLSSPFSVSSTRSFESLASPSTVGSNARPLLSPSSRFPLSNPSTPYFPPTSLCCSSLFPCSYSPASNHHHTPTFMPPTSYFGSYPELHSTHHNFPSSKLDNSSLSSAAAVFFPKAPEACSQLYVPYLSALMDFSSGLDPMSHHHHLSPITLTHHHRAIDPATSSMIYHPMVCPPVTRTLP